MDERDGDVIDLNSEDIEDPRRRMIRLSIPEVSKVYKKGFSLLQKAGFRADDAVIPPIRITLRKPREGLKDDDIQGRRAVGESKAKSEPARIQGAPEGNSVSIRDDEALRILNTSLPRISHFLERRGGSCSVKDFVHSFLKPVLPGITVQGFLVNARFLATSKYGFRITESEDQLVISKPIRLPEHKTCCCGKDFRTRFEFLSHVLNNLDVSHQMYMRLVERYNISPLFCLACKSKGSQFCDLLSLSSHCKVNSHDTAHTRLGHAIVSTFIDDNMSSDKSYLINLFYQALEDCDEDFPWGALVSDAADPLEEIKFMSSADNVDSGPPTPIHLDDDSSQDDEVRNEVVEILDLESNFINLEE